MKFKYSSLPLSRIGKIVKVNELEDGETAIPSRMWRSSRDIWKREGNAMILNGKEHFYTAYVPFFEDPRVYLDTGWITLEIIE